MSLFAIRRAGLACLTAALFFGSCQSSFAAGAPASAWQILQASHPTNFVAGTSVGAGHTVPEYELFVTNVGGAPASNPVVSDTLPTGVTAVSAQYHYAPGARVGVVEGTCSVSSQTVTCTVPTAVAAGTSLSVRISLAVSPTTPSVVTNEVTVEGGGAVTTGALETAVTTALPFFEILPGQGLSTSAYDERGETPAAGAHPFLTAINIGVPGVESGESWTAVQQPRNISLELPQGFVVDPMATSTRCSQQVLSHQATTNPNVYCPQASQVGVAFPVLTGALQHAQEPLYNVEPPPGVPAALAFEIEGTTVEILGGVNGGFHLTAKSVEIVSRFQLAELTVVLWGVPSDERHDGARFGGEKGSPDDCVEGGCGIEPSPAPFITMPTSCTEPTEVTTEVESWLEGHAEATRPLTDKEGNPAAVEGCNALAFEPTISSQATTNAAETSSGLEFKIHQPQEESLEGRSTAALKNATVTLPEGVSLNPAAANGLSSCSEEQMGYEPEEGKVRFKTTAQTCPDSAKVGTVTAKTPLLEEELPGSIYVATPYKNPFGTLLGIYLALESEKTGVTVKLAGKVEPNPVTGQLTATFEENPELPVEDITLHFFEGAQGALTTPLTCGTHTTTSTLTPWSTPEGIDVHPTSSFETTTGCSSSEAAAPKTVAFTAGTESPLSGAYSPFVLRLARPDGSQHITGISTTLPKGLLARLAGVSYCPESGIAQAISREHPEKGKEEIASPSCPSSSEVGTVNVTAGSGISPYPVSGHAYLAGPYKGAPLSLVVIVPAVAGPFDLGTVVDRVALNVDEYTAQVNAVADPLPTIREGIPLDVRSIELKLNRSQFTLNPTSCEAKAVEGAVSTQAGQTQAVSNRFQVGECGRLAFKPKLSLSLKGATKRTGHPSVKATVTYPKGEYANIAKAQVSLPHSEFLHQAAIAGACTKVILANHACPASSIYGKAKAWTPLLDQPLEGPVYLVGGYGYKLPALVAELNGQIRFLLVGKVDTGSNGGIRNTFESVPDAPVEKFVLELKGGKKYGLLENSENVCKKTQKAQVSFTAQNGRQKSLSVAIANGCKGGGKKGKKK